MIAHASVSVSDYAKSKEFYSKLLAPVGYVVGMDVPDYKACGFTQDGRQDFWIGQSETPGQVHVAFTASSKEEVDAFHAAGIESGGTDNGGPGYRTEYSANYYASFVKDPDGNNIEAVWFDPDKA